MVGDFQLWLCNLFKTFPLILRGGCEIHKKSWDELYVFIHSFFVSTLADILLFANVRRYLLYLYRGLGIKEGNDVIPVFRNLHIREERPLSVLATMTDAFCWDMVKEDFAERAVLMLARS